MIPERYRRTRQESLRVSRNRSRGRPTSLPRLDRGATFAPTLLIDAGADVNARFIGPYSETPLHWAASSNDVEVVDELLDNGADIEAPGSVIGGGTPLADAPELLFTGSEDTRARFGNRAKLQVESDGERNVPCLPESVCRNWD